MASRRLAERGVADQIGLDAGLPLAIVANDAGRPLRRSWMSARATSGTPPCRAGDGTRNLLEHLPVGARAFLEQDADRDGPIAGVELCQRRADIADGRDADRFRQALGRDAETHREVPARINAQFRAG